MLIVPALQKDGCECILIVTSISSNHKKILFYYDNTVVEVWLGLSIKVIWLGRGKDHGLD